MTAGGRIMKKMMGFLAAMQTGLVLLVLVGLAAALGSAFLPDTFYKTIIFKILLGLLFFNLLLCTSRQIRGLPKAYARRLPARQLLMQTGLTGLHLGVVLIIAGGAVCMYWGQTGEIHLVKGQSADIREIKAKKPFVLQLDDFEMRYNEDGSTAQYYSYLTILKNHQAEQKAVISVNHPLRYQGVKVYQMSYGYFIKVQLVLAGEKQTERLCREGDRITFPDSRQALKAYRYLPDFDPRQGMTSRSMRPNNPHLIFSVYKGEQLQGIGAVKAGGKVRLDAGHEVVFTGVEPYTVLKLKSDPGLPLVLCGGVLLTMGVTMAWIAAVLNRKAAYS